MIKSTIAWICSTYSEMDLVPFLLVFNSEWSWCTIAFIWELKCLWILSHTLLACFHTRTHRIADSEMVESIHVNMAWSCTIQESYFLDITFARRSCSFLNTGGFWGLTTTLWSFWESITPSTCWFHRIKLDYLCLIDTFGEKMFVELENSTTLEIVWGFLTRGCTLGDE